MCYWALFALWSRGTITDCSDQGHWPGWHRGLQWWDGWGGGSSGSGSSEAASPSTGGVGSSNWPRILPPAVFQFNIHSLFFFRCPDSKKQCKWKTTRALVSLNHDHQYWEYVTRCVCLHTLLEKRFLTSKYCYNICLLKQKHKHFFLGATFSIIIANVSSEKIRPHIFLATTSNHHVLSNIATDAIMYQLHMKSVKCLKFVNSMVPKWICQMNWI